MQFKGFTPDTVKYLHDVKANNSKIWYEEHREDYKKHVRQPFIDLVEELTPAVRSIDPSFITEPSKCLSRIYRDSRFSKDKHLYRDSAWLWFRRPCENSLESPAFFAEIMTNAVRWGMGAYESVPKAMVALRKFISAHPEEFAKASKAIDGKNLLIMGEKYKRMPSGLSEKAEAMGLGKWYEMKGFYISSPEYPHEKFFSPEIVGEISRDFTAMAPFYSLLIKIEEGLIIEEAAPPENPVEGFEW